MNITGKFDGRTMTIEVDFDEPGQVPLFNQYFEEMLRKFAEENGGQMTQVASHDMPGIVGEDNIDAILMNKAIPSKKEE